MFLLSFSLLSLLNSHLPSRPNHFIPLFHTYTINIDHSTVLLLSHTRSIYPIPISQTNSFQNPVFPQHTSFFCTRVPPPSPPKNIPHIKKLPLKMAHIPTNNTVLNDFFHALPQPTDTFLATYVWLGNCSKEVNMRSKVRTLYKRPTTIKDFPVWNYDGSSTGQAVTEDSEVWLKPVFFCLDPFSPITTSGGNSGRAPPQNYIVLCETVLPTPELIPTPDNFRRECERVHNTKEAQDENVWYGLEQEYILTIGSDSTHPLGWPNKDGSGMRPQGPYYCSVGTENAFGRQFCHYF